MVVGIFLLQANAFAFVRLGLKGGVNFANISSDEDSVSYQRTPGFTVGAALDIAVTPAMSIRTDLLYVQKDVKFEAGGQEGRLNLDEAVLAPFLVLRYPLPKVLPFLQVGPEFSLTTKAKSDIGGVKRSISDQWRNDNYSINAGGGAILPLGPAADLTLDARYNFGLVNLNTRRSDFKTRTNGIQVFVGYNFLKI
jgi:opacity protein-like surface antigen